MRVIKETNYGIETWTNRKMDKLHRKECLCLNCRKIKTCPKAERLFAETVTGGLALAVTRCAKWEPIGGGSDEG